MGTVAEHYSQHLAAVYLWMAGGFDSALARGEAEIEALLQGHPVGRTAIDLGAGFGMHSIPLARRGYSVLAVDTSALLADQLREQAGALPIRIVEDDLLAFPKYVESPVNLILCMGDTLTHLASLQDVEQLASLASKSLLPGGRFIATFRDYTVPLVGEKRFIPVRSDGDRILTCFLEYLPDALMVHDILHERSETGWQMRVSAYSKLRISPDWLVGALQSNGFSVRVEPGVAGMVRVVATRPS